jgi:hypothetical protein
MSLPSGPNRSLRFEPTRVLQFLDYVAVCVGREARRVPEFAGDVE